MSFLSKKEALVGIEELSSDSETTITQQGMQRQQHMSQRKTSSAMAFKDQTDTTTGEQQMISSKSEQQVTKVIPKHTHIKILVFDLKSCEHQLIDYFKFLLQIFWPMVKAPFQLFH